MRLPETENGKGVPNKGARGARDPGRAHADLVVFGVELGQPEGAHDDSHDENGEKHGQEPGPGIALAVSTVAREAHRRALVPRRGVLWLLHLLPANDVPVHLGVLGVLASAPPSFLIPPRLAWSRIAADRSRARPGVKTLALVDEKSHLFGFGRNVTPASE